MCQLLITTYGRNGNNIRKLVTAMNDLEEIEVLGEGPGGMGFEDCGCKEWTALVDVLFILGGEGGGGYIRGTEGGGMVIRRRRKH